MWEKFLLKSAAGPLDPVAAAAAVAPSSGTESVGVLALDGGTEDLLASDMPKLSPEQFGTIRCASDSFWLLYKIGWLGAWNPRLYHMHNDEGQTRDFYISCK